MTVPDIRTARPDEIPAVGALIARSFNHLDPCGYLVPPPAGRERVLAGFFTLYTEHAHRHGRVDVVDRGDGIAGAAVWFDRTGDLPEPADYGHRLAGLAGPYLDRFEALDRLFDKYHPGDPHWHLAFLAVHRDHRNRGLGGALMRRREAELDPAGVPQYLEATNARNVRLYRRHGYRDMDPYEILLPDGTPFYRMWRPAGA